MCRAVLCGIVLRRIRLWGVVWSCVLLLCFVLCDVVLFDVVWYFVELCCVHSARLTSSTIIFKKRSELCST